MVSGQIAELNKNVLYLTGLMETKHRPVLPLKPIDDPDDLKTFCDKLQDAQLLLRLVSIQSIPKEMHI